MKTIAVLRTLAAFLALAANLARLTPENLQQFNDVAGDFVSSTQAYLASPGSWSLESSKPAKAQNSTAR